MKRQYTPTNWTTQAACTGADLDIFYPHDSVPPTAAKSICRICPVQAACLAYAQDHDEKHGIWGGLTHEERRAHQRRTTTHQPTHPGE